MDSVLVIFSKAEEHGLQPALFNYDLIKDEYSKALAGGETGYKHLANTELLISDALIKICVGCGLWSRKSRKNI